MQNFYENVGRLHNRVATRKQPVGVLSPCKIGFEGFAGFVTK